MPTVTLEVKIYWGPSEKNARAEKNVLDGGLAARHSYRSGLGSFFSPKKVFAPYFFFRG